MSTIPTLALIPSGVKASKVYSVLPTDGTGDFTFSRAGALPSFNATRVNSEGLIEEVLSNVPRLNYPMIDGVVSGCPSLLLEPQRMNLVAYSEAFDNAAWIKVSNTSISDNFAISPNGTQNSSEIKATSTSTSVLGFYTGFTVSSGVEYTVSFFVKKGIAKYIQLYHAFSQVAGVPRTNFDLENGVVSVSDAGHTSSIEDYGNGWYRCIVKLTTATTILQTFFNAVKSPTAPRDASSSWSANDNFYFYGAQLEQGSYPTSYIKSNSGTTTTRVAETANGAGDANTFNGSEGVLFVEMSALADDSTSRRINLRNSSGSNQIRIEYGTSPNLITGVLFNGTNQAVVNNTSNNILNFNKIAFKYKTNDFAMWINGVKVGTDIIGTTIGAGILDRIDLSLSGTQTYSNTKQLQYFDSALNDSDLETLTSWTSFSEMATSQLYTIE